MYEIAEWNQRYEVSIKGREPKEGEELRAGPLSYVRLKVYGHKQGAGYRRLQAIAGSKFMEIFGIFCKFLEISGNQDRGKRGELLNEKENPASVSDLAFIIGCPAKQIENAIGCLCQIGWVTNSTKHNIIQHNTTQAPRKSRELPEHSGNRRLFAYTEGFSCFWGIYPKKIGKGKAFEFWQKINPDIELQQKILIAVEQQKQTAQWRKDSGQFIPHPATWLNQERWEDETGAKPQTTAEAKKEFEEKYGKLQN